MERPRLSDYSEVPNSTTTGAHYNYRNYAIDLDAYIDHLKKQAVKTRNESVEVCPHCSSKKYAETDNRLCLDCNEPYTA